MNVRKREREREKKRQRERNRERQTLSLFWAPIHPSTCHTLFFHSPPTSEMRQLRLCLPHTKEKAHSGTTHSFSFPRKNPTQKETLLISHAVFANGVFLPSPQNSNSTRTHMLLWTSYTTYVVRGSDKVKVFSLDLCSPKPPTAERRARLRAKLGILLWTLVAHQNRDMQAISDNRSYVYDP